MSYYRILLLIVYLLLVLRQATATENESKSTRMCIKDGYYICEGDLDLAGTNPHTISFSGMVHGELDLICAINLQNGYKDPQKKCYGTSDSNDSMLHFVLNKTFSGNHVHKELVADFLYKNGKGKPEEDKIEKWVVKAPEILRYQVQVNGMTLSKDQKCNIEATEDLKVNYNCDSDSFQQECNLIITEETDKLVRVLNKQSENVDLHIPIYLKGSTFTFKLQVCQHEQFIANCTVFVANGYSTANDIWLLLFIVVLVVLIASVLLHAIIWFKCVRQRKEEKKEKVNYFASVVPLMQPLKKNGGIV